MPSFRKMIQEAVHVLMHWPGGIGVTRSLRLGTPYSTAFRTHPFLCMYLELNMVMSPGFVAQMYGNTSCTPRSRQPSFRLFALIIA